MIQPLVGITLDLENKSSYSSFPWYAARKNYADSVILSGGTPLFIPHENKLVENYTNLIDALIITGGDFDINPNLYGEMDIHHKVNLKNSRTDFEFKITELAMKLNIPILGICGGQQLLNVVLGGSLFQHIPDEIKTDINHEQTNPRDEPSHDVLIENDTQLASIIGTKKMFVNSAHHQSVKNTGKGVKVNAVASDGIIEGIEYTTLDYCIGVQWHPEFLIDNNDIKIFSALVNAANKFKE